MGDKHKLLEILRKFSKIYKIFLRKLRKRIILAYFSKDLTKNALIFARLDEKRKYLGNFEKVLKVFDENSIEKLNFYFIFIFILVNLLLKIEPSEITPFSTTIFCFGGISPFPLATPLIERTLEILNFPLDFSTYNYSTEIFMHTFAKFTKFS